MTADTLPPLPEPADHRYKFVDYLGREVWESGVPYGAKVLETQALYTADQLRAAVLAERAMAAELLDMLKRIAEAEFGYGGWPKESEVRSIIARAEAIRATSQEENERG
jgi:protein-disulfide isomerase-like protein with CxxC motif